ncbi:MAG: RNA polymerase factor sigma-54 [Candidatus Kapabacteria bacterium]|jgi:RNA polymerase sigma-54 factor|nr:RNA polymerase factor sigma-54 [Candidatus Kapabacteria bacterium]
MIGLGLGLELGLEQKLTPQQVQYLKLLQLTGLQLEQHISQELEMNPMLEEGSGETEFGEDTELSSVETIAEDAPNEADNNDIPEDPTTSGDADNDYEIFDREQGVNDEEQTWIDFIEDESSTAKYNGDDDDDEGFPMPDARSVLDDLEDQLRLLNLSEEEQIISEEILGSIEPSGYLYRDLAEIVIAVNEKIDALNDLRKKEALTAAPHTNGYYKRDYMNAYKQDDDEDEDGDFESMDLSLVKRKPAPQTAPAQHIANPANLLQHVNLDMVEEMLFEIQTLDPPGIGSRDLRECLLAQLQALPKRNAAQQLAKLVLEKTYDAFRMKHYEVIMRELKVNDVYLREALKAIRALNPKPGGLETGGATSSIIPDFLISFEEEKSDFLIQLNDSRVPTVRVNKMYEQMKNHVREFTQRGMKSQRMNKDTRKFLKQKFDDAKFLILALKQRRHTMIRVMTAIVYRQREFFLRGKNYVRPLIYKDIAEDTGVDISTVCRVVNNKYAQTDFGVYELRYFFSEGLPMPKDPVVGGTLGVAPIEASTGEVLGDDGDGDTEISTRVIKEKLKELIAAEPKDKPLSDDKLVQELAKIGFTIARRTVAKYRDLAGIPPARLRREL